MLYEIYLFDILLNIGYNKNIRRDIMARADDTMGILQQNLVDAGCSEQEIKCCLTLAANDNWTQILPILQKHRIRLLEGIHNGQNRLDCLDFLIYQISKEHTS